MKRTLPVLGLVMIAGAALGGCAGGSGGTSRAGDDAAPVLRAADESRRVAIFNERGERVTWEDMLRDAAIAEAVFLGEQHGQELGLSAAAALWRDLIAREASGGGGFRGALALEFIERDDQSRLDDFLAGLSDEATFVRRAGRSSAGADGGNWSAGHRDMVLAAKDAGRPVIAANSPRAYVRLARTKGFAAIAALSEEQRRLVTVPREMPRGRYREDFERMMGGGDASATAAPTGDFTQGAASAAPVVRSTARMDVEGFFRAQSVWDWTMAQSVNDAIGRGLRPTVLVVGQFHSDFRGGLVQALDAIRPGRRIVTVSFQSGVSRSAMSLESEHLGRASFVVGTGE